MSASLSPGILDAALAALDAGFCVVPPLVDGSDRPQAGWHQYRSKLPSCDRVRIWYAAQGRTGIGFLLGAPSGRIEALEFVDAAARDTLVASAEGAGLAEMVQHIETGYSESASDGRIRWYFRTGDSAPEYPNNPNSNALLNARSATVRVLGDGAYVVAAPTAANGLLGSAYAIASGGPATVANVGRADRAKLLEIVSTIRRMDGRPMLAAANDGPAGYRLDPNSLGPPENPAEPSAGDANSSEARGSRPTSRIELVRLADVAPEPVDWLWSGWLARGKVHLIGGLPGCGKSTLAAALAAEYSVGGVWPDGTPAGQGSTVFLLAEDGLADTLRPRLDLHGANVRCVHALKAVREPDGSAAAFSLDRHLGDLRESVARVDAKLVVVDPLSGFMPGKDRNAEGDVRDVLTRLAAFADEASVAVLGVVHVGKPGATERSPLQRLLGATAFGAVARVVWMVADLPGSGGDDPRRLIAVVKNNLSPLAPPLEWSRPSDGPIAWHGESARTLEQVMGGGKPRPIDAACAFLERALCEGPRLGTEVEAAARAAGISGATLRRARREVGVNAVKQGGMADGPWLWDLGPSEEVSNGRSL